MHCIALVGCYTMAMNGVMTGQMEFALVMIFRGNFHTCFA